MTQNIDPQDGSQPDELSASISDDGEVKHFKSDFCHLLIALQIPTSGRAKTLTKHAVTRSLQAIELPKVRRQ
jgi:hypothetical protein